MMNTTQERVKPGRSSRNGAVDFLKFVFAVIIVLYHSKNLTQEHDSFFVGGAIGVEFFFIVSGYLMAASAVRRLQKPVESVGPETTHFIWRKVKGMLPNIYIAWVIAFIVETYGRHAPLGVSVNRFFYSAFELLFVTQSGLDFFRANSVTWYISAMLIAMAILYPILLRYPSLFLNLLAPLIAIFILGYLAELSSKAMGGPNISVGLTNKGMLRALAEISLGATCFSLNQLWKHIQPTKALSALLTVVESVCYLGVVAFAFNHGHSYNDFLMVLALAIGIPITFSGKSFLPSLFSHRVFHWLGAFSFDLYLSHGFWSHVMLPMFPQRSYLEILPIYLVAAVLTALFVHHASNLLRLATPSIKERLARVFIASEPVN